MHLRVFKSVGLAVALATAALAPLAGNAQEAKKPAAKPAVTADAPSRWDVFVGYSYLAPKDTVQVMMPDGTTQGVDYKAANVGFTESLSYYFGKYVGWQVDSGQHALTTDGGSSNGGFFTLSTGPVFRYPTSDITLFAHALAGGARVGGPMHEPYRWGPQIMAGGGLDYETPWFNHRLAIRVVQADYEYIHANWGQVIYGGRANINAARLSAGLVYHIGSIAPPAPPTIACSANPTTVYPGDPVSLTATASGLNPKQNALYTWSGEGVTGNGTTATVATGSMTPGSYTVKCGVKEGKPGKEGLKPWENAEGTTTFTVKQFEPPTVSCSASPSTIKPGETSTITSKGVSPQNRPLTYTYSAQAGTVSGTDSTATYSSTGAPTGPVDITCGVSDDKGQTASSTTSVTIVAPPPPPQPHAETLCSINFSKDKARPTRVDNEAKACLDEVALDLQKSSDAKAVLVGNSNAKEQAKTAKQKAYAAKHKRAKVEDPASQRAVNTKDYLVTEKGIDPSRISVATGTEDSQSVENYLVPAGADFASDVKGTTAVDESSLKVQKRKELGKKHHK
jgi:hypothetical protein